jgi:hypothetical protein
VHTVDNPAPIGIKDLADRFQTPNAQQFGPVPIWWWSGDKVTRERLRWQMEQLLSQGVAQAVIMNLAPAGPLYGALADDPAFMSDEWWELFLGACEDADELGFRFWPYDQIGFSGANFQGRIVTGNPGWAGRKLGRAEAQLTGGEVTIAVPQNARPLSAYAVSHDGRSATAVPVTPEGATWSGDGSQLVVVYSQEHGFDYFNREAVDALMDTVHGEFERKAGQWFGKVIVGFFQDELPNMPTWSDSFADEFVRVTGRDVLPMLGALWGDPVPGANDGSDADLLRLDYERLRTRLAREGFFDPLDAWARKHGMQYGFDQQSPAREGDPVGSAGVYGDYLETHSSFSAPGSDHLGDPKVHSSLSHLSGGSRTWIEAFHSSGWGGTLEETYDWLAPFLKRGATLYDPHAVYYSTPGGWWEWAPPSTCWRQPYWPEYNILAHSVTRLSEALSYGTLVCDTALVFPTSTVQAGFTFSGPTSEAADATRVYHELNGETAWSSERPGAFDRAGREYEIVGDGMLAGATVDATGLHIGAATFRNVVLPAVAVLDDASAATLASLLDNGGVVVAVETTPTLFAADGPGAQRLRRHIADGTVQVVARATDVPAALDSPVTWVQAEVPVLLRSVGDSFVLALFAHDETSGTEQPILKGSEGYLDWIEVSWSSFWEGLREGGYNFRPVGDRRTRLALHGMAGLGVQRWNPKTGERHAVTVSEIDGTLVADIGFEDGSVALLVIGPELPEAQPEAERRSATGRTVDIDEWLVTASSTIDNRWGDFAARERNEVLPLEVWSVECATGDEPHEWTPAVATYGPYAEIAGPTSDATLSGWAPVEWSLSRGIRNDAVHQETLGPKGYVPEEFLSWPTATPGDRVAARTTINVPTDGLSLVVGANAAVRVLSDGMELPVVTGGGYWKSVAIERGSHEIELQFLAERTEAIRASFAVVADLTAYRRAEWLVPTLPGVPASVVTVSTLFDLAEMPADTRIQVGAEQPCTVVINGAEVGRQNAFHPYGSHREARFVPYDLRPHLVVGENRLKLRSVDSDREAAVVVDSAPLSLGGLGILTGHGSWTGTRDGSETALRQRSQQWQDPRFLALVARPHPLPRAAWLERPPFGAGVVADLVPDVDPGDTTDRWLRFLIPVGATRITVPTSLPFEPSIDGHALAVEGNDVHLPTPAGIGTHLLLRFTAVDGRRGGALLDEPIRVITQEAPATLMDWSELGYGALAGEVAYRATLPTLPVDETERVTLDLGAVRGSARVLVDGVELDQLAWGPYRVDITDHLTGGAELEVKVHNTLAGYLDVASPTPGVFAGQKRAGMLGPVRLVVTRSTP